LDSISFGSDVAVNAFNCTCRAGFTGDTCHDDIDECASAPCFNGGVCTQTRDASFECECAASEELMISHYEGDLCETEIGVNKIWFIVGGIAIFFLLVALCMSYLYVHNKKNVLVFQIETLDIGVAQFENARMSMVEESQGMIVIEVRMKNWDTIHDVCQRLQDREHIPIREQRLFFMSGNEEMLDPSPKGPSLEKLGIQNGSRLRLLQVWGLKLRQRNAPRGQDDFQLECVERHWRISSIKMLAQDVSGITASSMTLRAPDGTELADDEKLPTYRSITNGSVLEMEGEKPKKPPPKKREKSVGASVMGMASAFGAGRVPGATLSELQENSMLRDRAAQPGGRP